MAECKHDYEDKLEDVMYNFSCPLCLKEQVRLLQAELEKIKQQLKEGHHCQSFGMCGEAHNEYERNAYRGEIGRFEKRVEQLQSELDNAKEEKRRLRSGLGILIQNWISVQKISDENYTEESDVILSNAQQALKGGEEWQEDI